MCSTMVIQEHDEKMSEEECAGQAVRHVGNIVQGSRHKIGAFLLSKGSAQAPGIRTWPLQTVQMAWC